MIFFSFRPFRFVGTNAYWLPVLNSDEDIANTLANMSAKGIKVVRVWAFNDVESPTDEGVYFQTLSNGVATINDGPNGLQRLDKVIELAEKQNMWVIPSLTNNWFPTVDNTPSRRWATDTPRNYLSNDYGGMDAYVKAFVGTTSNHDQFYTNEKILNSFMNYTTQIVSRYVNSPAVFAWELANDPRCYSTLTASSSCTPQTITQWHSTVAQHIKSIDPNHLVSSGSQGFFCVDCPKLFPLQAPPPQASPAPGSQRRSVKPLSKSRLFLERQEARKRAKEARSRAGIVEAPALKIRGKWGAATAKRQSSSTASAFDGSQGVDSQDILNIPEIGFGTAQLFPDQNQYAVDGLDTTYSYDALVQEGISWIQLQAQSAQTYGKPVFLTGFGLVSESNAPFFVPFNNTLPVESGRQFITDQQRDEAYVQWLNAGYTSGLAGMVQYQWGQSNLTVEAGTAIAPPPTSAKFKRQGTSDPNYDSSAQSPNDGYACVVFALSGGVS
ncbi:glycoside hydrolase [Heliocybe sulcata]|uniref:mannan endo-1,4-beta-mannosidase n=1 Tax=Heliocybe sulcata TaxID=5364 RepID=A0A5C3NMD1_9AGAM|nr:glycoside hydrolase [Heliocybe sulcata]